MITDVLVFTLIVHDQEEALAFYTEKLGFEKRADQPMGPGRRWVTIAPPQAQVIFTLQPPTWFEGQEREDHERRIGQNPTIVLRVDDCRKTIELLRGRGVEITQQPTQMPYGLEGIINDLYGNTLVLLEPQA